MDKLIDKQYREYDYFSRYTSFPFYYNTVDKKYIYGTTTQLNNNVPYVLYKTKVNDTLDSIALDYYNNPTYFWIIADFNRIQDPYINLQVGTVLKIPALSDVTFQS